MHYVYTYKDPRPSKDSAVVYVGKGSGNRAFDHWEKPSMCKNRKLKHLLNLLRRDGLKPIIEIVFEFETEKEALDKEIELIELYGRSDLEKGLLFNGTDGGEGLINISPETLGRRSASIKATYNTPKKKIEQSERALASWKNPEFKKKRIEEIHVLAKDPAYRELLSKTITASHANPEVRAKIGKASVENWENPEYREKCIQAMKTEETFKSL